MLENVNESDLDWSETSPQHPTERNHGFRFYRVIASMKPA